MRDGYNLKTFHGIEKKNLLPLSCKVRRRGKLTGTTVLFILVFGNLVNYGEPFPLFFSLKKGSGSVSIPDKTEKRLLWTDY